MNGNSLDDIAKSNNLTIKKVNSISITSPTMAGVGFEPKVVGSMFKANIDTFVTMIEGEKGVFAFKVTERENPTPLPNYEAYRQRIAEKQRTRATKVFDALKKTSDIEDNRPVYYGIN